MLVARRLAGRDPRAAVPGAGGSRRAGAGRRRADRLGGCSTWARTGSRSSATCRAGCRPRSFPTSRWSRTTTRRSSPRLSALLLIGFSQTAGDARCVRNAPPVPHRRQPGVGRAGHGERRRRRVSGHARVDEPVGELAQRVRRAPNTPVASLTTGALVLATLIVLAPAVLGPAQGGARRGDHRRGRVRDDRRRASCAGCTASPASTSGSRWRRSSACCRPASSPAS